MIEARFIHIRIPLQGSAQLVIDGRARIASQLESQIVLQLLAASGPAPGSQLSSRGFPGYLERAESFIREKARADIRLADVAMHVNVSPRTICQNFRKFLGISPMSFLRSVRLDNARADLLARAAPSVTDIALQNGFPHLGRFARDYMTRFGEPPSRTFRASA